MYRIPQYVPYIKEEYADAVKNQILTTWIGNGPKVKEFEEKFAEYVGVKHAIACSSGTAALMIAMKTLDLHEDTVCLPAYGFIAATNACRFLNLYMRYYDVLDNDGTIIGDLDFLESGRFIVNGKEYTPPRAIVIVDQDGIYNSYTQKLINAYQIHNVKVIEDAACALGTRFNKIHAGTTADIGIFSFSVPKILTTGQGGMLVTNDDGYAQRIREIIDQGSTTWRQDGFHPRVGANFKFNDILAAYGLQQLYNINELLVKRYQNYIRYINNGIKLLEDNTNDSIGFSTWMNVYRVPYAAELKQYLAEKGIESKMLYRPIRDSVGAHTVYPNAEKLYKTSLYLPSSLSLTEDEIDEICDHIHTFERKYNES